MHRTPVTSAVIFGMLTRSPVLELSELSLALLQITLDLLDISRGHAYEFSAPSDFRPKVKGFPIQRPSLSKSCNSIGDLLRAARDRNANFRKVGVASGEQNRALGVIRCARVLLLGKGN